MRACCLLECAWFLVTTAPSLRTHITFNGILIFNTLRDVTRWLRDVKSRERVQLMPGSGSCPLLRHCSSELVTYLGHSCIFVSLPRPARKRHRPFGISAIRMICDLNRIVVMDMYLRIYVYVHVCIYACFFVYSCPMRPLFDRCAVNSSAICPSWLSW